MTTKPATTLPREDRTPESSHQLRLTMVGPYRISTVNLGAIGGSSGVFLKMADTLLDPLFNRTSGQFETMVFRGSNNRDLDLARYATIDAAVDGHEAMVAKWQQTGGDGQPASDKQSTWPAATGPAPQSTMVPVLSRTAIRRASRYLEMPVCGDVCELKGAEYVVVQTDYTDPERPVLRFARREDAS